MEDKYKESFQLGDMQSETGTVPVKFEMVEPVEKKTPAMTAGLGDENGNEAPYGINFNRFTTKKTIAQGMLDIALLTANVSQLKYVMRVGKEDHPYYVLMLTLLSISIALQVTVGVCFVFIGSVNINKPKSHKTADFLNNLITSQIFIITVINIIITSFGVDHHG